MAPIAHYCASCNWCLTPITAPKETGKGASREADAMLSGTPAGNFWQGLLGEGNLPRRLGIFDLLFQAFLPFRKNRPEDVPVMLKLPLAGRAADVALQSVFWIDLLSGLLRGARLAPNLFMRTPAEGGVPTSLHVFFQRPDETNFAALLTRRYEADYVTDLTDPGLANAIPGALSDAARRQVEDDRAALSEVVRFRWMS